MGQSLGIRVDHELKLASGLTQREIALRSHEFLPQTNAILEYFRNKRWEMVRCQFPVYNPPTRARRAWVATSIDVVVQDLRTRRLLALEIKTGYDGYFNNSPGQMTGRLSFLGNCPLHQAILQLVAGMILAGRCGRQQFRRTQGHVLNVVGTTVFDYSLARVPWLDRAWAAVERLL